MPLLIERVEVIPIRAPRKEPVKSGSNAGDPVTASEFGIVRILTRDGLEGLGEISITFPRIAHSLCHEAYVLVSTIVAPSTCAGQADGSVIAPEPPR